MLHSATHVASSDIATELRALLSANTPYVTAEVWMPKRNPHELFLTVDLKDVQIKAKDVIFIVYRGSGRASRKVGELRVSQGALVWRGSFDQKGRKLGWTRFARLMEERGARAERRAPGAKKTVPRDKRG